MPQLDLATFYLQATSVFFTFFIIFYISTSILMFTLFRSMKTREITIARISITGFETYFLISKYLLVILYSANLLFRSYYKIISVFYNLFLKTLLSSFVSKILLNLVSNELKTVDDSLEFFSVSVDDIN
jgi:hypothetical protein